jgi:hypothetical protein
MFLSTSDVCCRLLTHSELKMSLSRAEEDAATAKQVIHGLLLLLCHTTLLLLVVHSSASCL